MKVYQLILITVPSSLLIVGSLMFGLPLYSVWTAEQQGKATLARAESTRQAQIVDAKAKLEAAQYLSQAADQIQTKLTPEYLEYLRIQMLGEVGEHNPNVIYFEAQPLITAPSIKNSGQE